MPPGGGDTGHVDVDRKVTGGTIMINLFSTHRSFHAQ